MLPYYVKTKCNEHCSSAIRYASLKFVISLCVYFKNKVLFTQENLYNVYKDSLCVNTFSEIVCIKGGVFEELSCIHLKSSSTDALYVAFGGGSVIDSVKMFASMTEHPYLTIPSTLSNDAIYSPIARLIKRGKKRSFGVIAPIGIIVDTDVIRRSPRRLILAGVGDLVSNLSAKKDCEIAERNIGETIDAFALELASLGAESVLKFKVGDINTDLFINRLAYGLIFSGMAMIMSGNSRPASGAEHLISHAIDEYYPDRSTLHGVQVAWAQLMLEKYVRKDQQAYHQLYNFFKELGLYEMFSECLFFSEDDFRKLLPLAREMRKRYTVLNTIDL